MKTSEKGKREEEEEEEFYNGEEYSYEYEVGSCSEWLIHALCVKLQFKVMIDDVGLLQILSVVVVDTFLLRALSNS